jgi:sugar diacid utilization regulator
VSSDAIDEIAIGHAVAVLGLELLRQRTAQETEYRIAGELIQDVMTSGLSEQSMARARGLGFDLPDLRVATVITVGDLGRMDASPGRRALLRARIGRLRLSGAGAAPLVAELRERTVALWPAGVGEGAAERVRASLEAVFADTGVLVASSGLRATPVDAVRVALTVHDLVAASSSRGGAFEPPDLGYIGALLHVPDPAVLTALVERQLGAVREYDRRRGTALLTTLAAWLSHDCDRARTARALRVHPNTVQQRLRRVEALAGVTLSAPRDLLAVTAAVEILRLLREPAAGHAPARSR